MSLDTDFTSLANPHFDLSTIGTHTVQQKTNASLAAVSLREMLMIQPPLAKSERLPRTLKLNPGELAVTARPIPNYIRVPKLGFFVPQRHLLVLDLIAAELADPDIKLTHGTSLAYRRGCKGPLCRRAHREATSEAKELRQVRTGERSQMPSRSARYDHLRRTVAHYAAIEPLVFGFTVYSHQINRPASPTAESTLYLRLDSPLKLYRDMQLTYQPDVELGTLMAPLFDTPR